MANFGQLILTNQGLQEQYKAQNGEQLKFKRIAMGSGKYSGNISTLTELVTENVSVDISKGYTQNNAYIVEGFFSNESLQTGFAWREIGLFVEDADGNEVLYCYANAGDTYDYIPATTDERYSKYIRIATVIGNATDVTFENSEGFMYVDTVTFNAAIEELQNSMNEQLKKNLVKDNTPTKGSLNLVTSGGVFDALAGKLTTKSISPTKDYIDFVIPLCCLDNTDITANTYFRGTISLKRDNGSGERVCHIEVVCSKIYNTNNPSYSINGHVPSNMPIFPVRFNHNGKLYFGVYFKNTSSRYNIGSAYGYASHWAVIDCIGVYNYNDSTVLNTEIYNSMEYLESENSVPSVFLNTPTVRITNSDKTAENHEVYHTGNKPTPTEIGAVPTYKTSDYCQSEGWYRVGTLAMNAKAGSAAATIVVGGQFNNNQVGTFIVGATFSHNKAALQQYVGCGVADSTTHVRLNRLSDTEVAVEFYYARSAANTIHVTVQPEMGSFTLLPEVTDVTAETEDVLAEVKLSSTATTARIATGSYVGTGTCGANNKNRLDFDFTPKVVIFGASNTSAVACPFVYGQTLVHFQRTTVDTAYVLRVNWGENYVEWYYEEDFAAAQLNISGTKYNYVAIG